MAEFSSQQSAWPVQKQWFAVLVIAAVAIAVAAALWLWHGRAAPAAEVVADTPTGMFRPTPEQLKTLTIETVASSRFSGADITEGRIAVNGDTTTPVYSPYSGRVTRIVAKPGDHVRRGAALAIIEASEFVQGQNDIATAAAQVRLAKATEERKHALFDARGGSLQDWQQAQADLASAETSLRAARNRMRILGKSDAQIDALQASHHMDSAAALTAPIDGVVIDRQLGPGQVVQSGGGNALFTLADLSSVWLVANVREEDAPLVRKNQPVEVTVNALPGRVFKASISFVAPAIDPNTHRLQVRAQINNADGSLKPEMLATFRITTSEATASPSLPEGAIVYDGDQPHIWIARDDPKGTLIGSRNVTVGHTADHQVQILSGLSPGERVVTGGSLFIDHASGSD